MSLPDTISWTEPLCSPLWGMFDFFYKAPSRKPKLGHQRMVVGLLMLLFIGFNRIRHFTYLRLDAMLCGFFNLNRLPVAI